MYTLKFQATDTLSVQLNAAATSATLTTGSFGTMTGTQLLVVDYDVPAKREVISCTIGGTALTSLVRGIDGTSDVTHSANANVIMAFVPSHYGNGLGTIAANDAWTAFSPATTGFSGTPTTTLAKYMQLGKLVFIALEVTGTSNATSTGFSLPVAPKNSDVIGCGRAVDNSASTSTPLLTLTAASTTVQVSKDNGGGNTWTASGTKVFQVHFFYEAN
jgi:hypothetical protein